MVIKMIRPDKIAFHATVSEEDIRKRMGDEVLEAIGALDPEGRPLPGVTVKVTRGSSRAGGYTIDVTGPMPVRLMLPKAGE